MQNQNLLSQGLPDSPVGTVVCKWSGLRVSMSHLGRHYDFILGLAPSVRYTDLVQTITLSSLGNLCSSHFSSVWSRGAQL